jgi:hypothetical protein
MTQRQEVRVRDAHVDDELWCWNAQTYEWCYVPHDVGGTYWLTDGRFSDRNLPEDPDAYWWVITDKGERYAFQSIELEEAV